MEDNIIITPSKNKEAINQNFLSEPRKSSSINNINNDNNNVIHNNEYTKKNSLQTAESSTIKNSIHNTLSSKQHLKRQMSDHARAKLDILYRAHSSHSSSNNTNRSSKHHSSNSRSNDRIHLVSHSNSHGSRFVIDKSLFRNTYYYSYLNNNDKNNTSSEDDVPVRQITAAMDASLSSVRPEDDGSTAYSSADDSASINNNNGNSNNDPLVTNDGSLSTSYRISAVSGDRRRLSMNSAAKKLQERLSSPSWLRRRSVKSSTFSLIQEENVKKKKRRISSTSSSYNNNTMVMNANKQEEWNETNHESLEVESSEEEHPLFCLFGSKYQNSDNHNNEDEQDNLVTLEYYLNQLDALTEVEALQGVETKRIRQMIGILLLVVLPFLVVGISIRVDHDYYIKGGAPLFLLNFHIAPLSEQLATFHSEIKDVLNMECTFYRNVLLKYASYNRMDLNKTNQTIILEKGEEELYKTDDNNSSFIKNQSLQEFEIQLYSKNVCFDDDELSSLSQKESVVREIEVKNQEEAEEPCFAQDPARNNYICYFRSTRDQTILYFDVPAFLIDTAVRGQVGIDNESDFDLNELTSLKRNRWKIPFIFRSRRRHSDKEKDNQKGIRNNFFIDRELLLPIQLEIENQLLYDEEDEFLDVPLVDVVSSFFRRKQHVQNMS